MKESEEKRYVIDVLYGLYPETYSHLREFEKTQNEIKQTINTFRPCIYTVMKKNVFSYEL